MIVGFVRDPSLLAIRFVLAFALSLAGCIERPGAPIGPNVGFGQAVGIDNTGVSAVDVLFVIDNSGSMLKEQSAPRPADARPGSRPRAEPPDRDGDSVPDWNPAEELRIGITTTDVGTEIGHVGGGGRTARAPGDDGRLRDGVMTWSAGDDPDVFADRVRATVMTLGADGCAFEQPLEGPPRARSPTHRGPAFRVRDRLFALIRVERRRGSARSSTTTRSSPMSPAGLANVHCTRNRDGLTPIAELLETIRGTRDEDSFVFAAIAGFPIDLDPGATPAEILALPAMQHAERMTASGLRPVAVCDFEHTLDDWNDRERGGRSCAPASPSSRSSRPVRSSLRSAPTTSVPRSTRSPTASASASPGCASRGPCRTGARRLPA